MSKRLTSAFVVAGVCVLLAIPCSADGFGKRFDVTRLAEPLGLDEKQVNTIERLQDETVKAVLDLKRDVEYRQYELKKLLTDDSAKESKLYSLIDEIHKLRAEIQKTRVSTMLSIKSVLTPEQREKLEELRMTRSRGKRMKERHHRPGRGSGGGLDYEGNE